jgi:hypothetical protein
VLKGERKEVINCIDVTPLSLGLKPLVTTDDQVDRTQHRYSNEAQRDLLDRRRQPTIGFDSGLPG